MYRPPSTPFWKGISSFMFCLLVIVALCLVGIIFYQRGERNDLRNSKTSGILIEKRDLNRGDFLLVISEDSNRKEYVLSGFDMFYTKFKLGDSLIKKTNSFQFEIYRRDSSRNFQFLEIVGYD